MGSSGGSSSPPLTATRCHHLSLPLLLLLLLLLFGAAVGDISSDKQECQDSLVQLFTCLPYVQGDAAAPTPDCCEGLTQVLAKSPKCLCILIRDRDDPSLGLKIDLRRALSLQPSCKVAGDTASICPKLLNLDPNSPEAKVFKQFGTVKNGTATAGNVAGATAGAAPSTPISNSGGKINSTSTSNGGSNNYYGRKKGMYCFLASLLMLMAS